ncbi:MAG TPA: hydroxyisourate hydrolase [Steroidobacteraceae bacterium]|nr:hydroxyisourate hydrolase [Steroidobacteraceae bacterium]
MGRLSTHVLDTLAGRPAAGLTVELHRLHSADSTLLRAAVTDADGRTGPLLEGPQFTPGRYSLTFHAATYFRGCGVALPQPPFLEEVVISFGVAHPDQNWHVPLVMTPWSYSTYRGS